MKKEITKISTFCDVCEKEYSYPNKCLKCGIEMCYDCVKDKMVKYNHAVHSSGSGDGYYCNKCDGELLISGDNPIYNAYLKIKRLRVEASLFWEDFNKRADVAEKKLKEVQSENN